jgi:hypothetical protein
MGLESEATYVGVQMLTLFHPMVSRWLALIDCQSKMPRAVGGRPSFESNALALKKAYALSQRRPRPTRTGPPDLRPPWARTQPSSSRERISTKGRQNVDVRDVIYSPACISPTSTVLAEQPNGSGVEI